LTCPEKARAGLGGSSASSGAVAAIAALLLVLALLVGLIYLNRSGLPESPDVRCWKAPRRGFDFEMSRLRLRFYPRGLVRKT